MVECCSLGLIGLYEYSIMIFSFFLGIYDF